MNKLNLTEEQISIIRSKGDIKINAVAGSGKTTTLVELAKTLPRESNILYLAFNKSVKLEAINKFKAQGLTHIQVETAHSIAYKHIVKQHNYSLKEKGYKIHEISEILGLEGNGEKHTEFILANHINRLVSYFCNSVQDKVQNLNYLETIADRKAKAFASLFYDYIIKKTRVFLSKMNNGEIEIMHDFYLKKFQLSKPTLAYDYIFFDEGQDASAAMLDVFLNQKATKIIVGDTHQQIYGWRFAINSLEKTNFQSFNLSTSFRFSQDIADLAMAILKYKKAIGYESNVNIFGAGVYEHIQTKAVIARTNLGLLLKAIEYVTEKKKVAKIYFEGNINSYTYADDGTSLYDVLHLYNRRFSAIKDKLIKSMSSVQELEDYIDKTDDVQLRMMVEIVKEYGNKIPKIISEIKEKHIVNDDKEAAEIIFSTVHRCKGMEYDTIQMVDDFISIEKLDKLFENPEKSILDQAKINEEINLLYVAITRTKNSIYIPEKLVPADLPPSKKIHILKTKREEEKQKTQPILLKPGDDKAYNVQEISVKYADAYKLWTEEQDQELSSMYQAGLLIKDLAKHFDRTKGAIRSRLKKLEIYTDSA